MKLTIDGRRVRVAQGTTVLAAAKAAGVAVPSLCSHPELTPFGGCRLCAVEISGTKGYPLACSTIAEGGMEVLTDTVALDEARREILKLILSQHPSSCLVCGEEQECRRTQQAIRKTGVATGCRSCTRDGACELQQVAAQVGVEDIGHPVAYRGLEPENDEPFYDRDYNLCILCGRCVRMCAEVRGAGVLAFIHRGPHTLVGAAFGSSHQAAGCEFCGACVSVCPTGALADKVSKWDGAPDGTELSTCPLCALGCRVELTHAGGRLSAARGAHDAELNDGQLCVRGRFCLPETTQHPSRARRPTLRKGRYVRVVTWDEALDLVAERLTAADAARTLMLVSGDLTNEGLFAAQRLVRSGLRSSGVDSTVCADLPGGPALWSRLFGLPVSIGAVADAGAIVVAGLDPRFAFSVAGVQARRAVRRGARLITIDARVSSLSLAADHDLRPGPGDEAHALVDLLRAAREGDEARRRAVRPARVLAAAREFARATSPAVVIAPRVFDCPGAETLLRELEALAERPGASIVPLTHAANARGALELGALNGVLPGPRAAPASGRHGLSLASLRDGCRPAVLYLVGETPLLERPPCDFVIAQDLYPPPFEVDAFLPAASFAESAGTLTNLEGRVQDVRRVEGLGSDPDDDGPRPDWKVFSELAARLERGDLTYGSAEDVRAAIREELPAYPEEGDRAPRRMSAMRQRRRTKAAATEAPPGRGRYTLVPERAAFRHRSIDLVAVVEGLRELGLEDGVRMAPLDLERLGVEPGGAVTVRLDGGQVVTTARPDPGCPRGAVYATRVSAWGGLAGADRLAPLADLPALPLRVSVAAGDRRRVRDRRRGDGTGR